jgi:hypothetical protein
MKQPKGTDERQQTTLKSTLGLSAVRAKRFSWRRFVIALLAASVVSKRNVIAFAMTFVLTLPSIELQQNINVS